MKYLRNELQIMRENIVHADVTLTVTQRVTSMVTPTVTSTVTTTTSDDSLSIIFLEVSFCPETLIKKSL